MIRHALLKLTVLLLSVCTALSVVLISSEKIFIPLLERSGIVEASGWREDNRKIFAMNEKRNLASPTDPLWRSSFINPDDDGRDRILVMGDSIVWGDGYANANDLWWRQLENELLDRGYSVKIVAAGYPGWSLKDQVEALPKLMQTVKPALVIWTYTADDACIDPSLTQKLFNVPKEYFFYSIEKSISDIAPNLYVRMDRLRTSLIERILAHRLEKLSYPEWELSLVEGKNLEELSAVASRLKSAAAATNAANLLVLLPTVANVDYMKARFDPVKRCLEKNGVPFVDLTDCLKRDVRAALLERLQINPANAHPSRQLCSLWSESTASLIEKKYGSFFRRANSKDEAILNDWMPPVKPASYSARSITVYFPLPQELLKMPIGEPFMQFNLARPHPVAEVVLEGAGLTGAELFVTYLDASTESPILCSGKADGSRLVCRLDSKRKLNTIRVAASFTGKKRRVTLLLKEEEGKRKGSRL